MFSKKKSHIYGNMRDANLIFKNSNIFPVCHIEYRFAIIEKINSKDTLLFKFKCIFNVIVYYNVVI